MGTLGEPETERRGRKRESCSNRLPMRDMMCIMREGGRGGDGEPDRDKRKIDNVSKWKVREGVR